MSWHEHLREEIALEFIRLTPPRLPFPGTIRRVLRDLDLRLRYDESRQPEPYVFHIPPPTCYRCGAIVEKKGRLCPKCKESSSRKAWRQELQRWLEHRRANLVEASTCEGPSCQVIVKRRGRRFAPRKFCTANCQYRYYMRETWGRDEQGN